ncbi:major coat protein [Arsenophonus sp.]|uniref:major coat protein n=1 Tax=Arsenophonus sp. TaxID=1872640 RepID=UPI00285BBC79|nr:major coat protein [Arsenophonus sp.]MDR5617375.1 capsid protein [Arsenophonus sp.]MDR5617543.1 capsid protein [Arsenophonus sp.]MDR5617793.1 capsid protein [Arsenophonus sp.]MDR5617966.1 capsid protein [Arsenophonus sp.]MDR5618128.1 capsid protein [Arsenophonus sp.]
MKFLSNAKEFILNKYLAVSLFLFSGMALAEGGAGTTPDYAGQAMDSLLTQANTLIGKVWPVVVAVVGAGLAIRLFKKFSSKAV